MYSPILPILLCVWAVFPANGFTRADNTTKTGNETSIPLRKRPFGGRGFFFPRPWPGSGSFPGAKNGSDAIILEHTDKDNTTIYPVLPRRFSIYPPTSCPKERSCFGRCSSSRQFQNVTGKLKSVRCFCDPECNTVFHDCCADYERFCKETGSQEDRDEEDLAKKWGCGKVEGRDFGIWMIATCAQDWPDDEVRLKCENSSREIFLQGDPSLVVDNSNNIFRNRYCAKCNNVDKFTCFSLGLQNSSSQEISLKNTSENLPDKNEECPRITVNTSSNLGIRYCYKTQNSCKHTDNMTTVLNCRDGGTALVSFMNETFKNFHCLKCNHKYTFGLVAPKVSCGPDISAENRFNFAAMFKLSAFLNNEINPSRCSPGFLYDDTARACRKLLSISELRLENSTLLTKYIVQLDYRRNKRFNCFEYTKNSTNNLGVTMDKVFSGFKKAFERKIELNLRKTNWTLSDLVINIDSEIYTTVTFTILTIRYENMNETDWFSPVKLLNLEPMYFHYNPRNSSSLCGYSLIANNSREMNCLDESNVAINMDKVSISDNGTLIFQTTQKTFKPGEYILYKDRNQTKLVTCRKSIPANCKYILRVNSTWQVFQNQSIYSNVTKSWFDFGEYSINDGVLSLCLTEKVTSTKMKKENVKTVHETILKYSSLFCLSVSIISLVVLLVIYSITPALRNLPGKNLMSLCSVLALAQFLWLFQERAFEFHKVCIALSVLLHFLFLAPFSCSTSIAFLSFVTFHAIANGRLGRSSEGKAFLRYILFSIGFPFLWVIVFWLLDYNGLFSLGYGTTQGYCWLGNIDGLYVSFVAPVFTLLAINFAFLLATVNMIKKCSKASQKLAENTNGGLNKSQIWIYIRMSTLMGFTWLLGVFQLVWPGVVAFEYLFVFVNGLQGFYIAAAFLFTDNVKKILSKRVGSISTKSQSASK